MLNKVMLIGHLGRDPELKYSKSAVPMLTLNVATDESYTDKAGNKVEQVEWHRVVVFQRQAETCSTRLSKGSRIYVEGNLRTREWQDEQGQKRYTTEVRAQRVLFLDRRDSVESSGGGDGEGRHAGHGGKQQRRDAPDDLGPAFPSEASGMDDVPF